MSKYSLAKAKNIGNAVQGKHIDTLYKNISGYIHTARAGYGLFLLQELSNRLNKDFGHGFGLATVKDMRRFYSVYEPIRHAPRGESTPAFKNNLSWIHYLLFKLLSVCCS